MTLIDQSETVENFYFIQSTLKLQPLTNRLTYVCV